MKLSLCTSCVLAYALSFPSINGLPAPLIVETGPSAISDGRSISKGLKSDVNGGKHSTLASDSSCSNDVPLIATKADSPKMICSISDNLSSGGAANHLEEMTNDYEQSKQAKSLVMRKRGQVGETAGQIVTGLMVVGLVKQLYNAVAPAFQTHQQQPPQYSPSMMYANAPQYYGPMQKREAINQELNTVKPDGESEVKPMVKRNVMEIASHFVNLGFAVQTVQENVGPVSREIVRLEHKALHEARKWLHPEQQQQKQLQNPYYMKKRDIDTELLLPAERDQTNQFDKRAMMDAVLEHPLTHKVANSAGILVTISMLTGIGGRYIDSAIQMAKKMMPKNSQPPFGAGNPYMNQYMNPYMKKRSCT